MHKKSSIIISTLAIFLLVGVLLACDDTHEDSGYQESGYYNDQNYNNQNNYHNPNHNNPNYHHHNNYHNPNYGRGRITVTRWDVGKGNWLSPTYRIGVTVYGRRSQSAVLYSINNNGYMNSLQTLSCRNRQSILFRGNYNRMATKSFEIRLYDNMGRVIARHRRRP